MISTRRQMLASSISLLLFSRLTEAREPNQQRDVDWLDEIQRPPEELPADAPKLKPLLTDGDGKLITSLEQWKHRREELRKWWLEFLHPIDAPRDKVPSLEVLAEDQDEGVIRQLLRYEVEPEIFTEAYLLKPIKATMKLPGVAVFHSTVGHSIRQPAGVEGKPEKAFGLKLAQQGYVTFCPKNFLWPTNHKIEADQETKRFHARRPKCKGMAKMLHDATVAVDILAAQPEVDPSRVGSVGHSLGAKEVLYLAAFDERVKVTISSEGGIGTRFSNWDAPWYLGPNIKDRSFNHEHHELLGLIAPRPFLLIGGDSADGAKSWPFIEEAMKTYELSGERPRVGLLNHHKGHSVPPLAERRIYEWFNRYL